MRWLPVGFMSLCSFLACQTFAAERDARLANLSTRTIVGTESSMLVTGFVIGGTEPKDILVRAIGPTLASAGITNALAHARLELFASDGRSLGSNEQWAPSLKS